MLIQCFLKKFGVSIKDNTQSHEVFISGSATILGMGQQT